MSAEHTPSSEREGLDQPRAVADHRLPSRSEVPSPHSIAGRFVDGFMHPGLERDAETLARGYLDLEEQLEAAQARIAELETSILNSARMATYTTSVSDPAIIPSSESPVVKSGADTSGPSGVPGAGDSVPATKPNAPPGTRAMSGRSDLPDSNPERSPASGRDAE